MRSEAMREHPEHEVITERINQQVEVWLEGELIAKTDNAIKLKETGYDEVIYIPKNDLTNIDLLKSGDYDCPFKGHAELYTVKHGARDVENAAWSYEDPYDQVQELKGRVAFYPEKIQEIRIH
jgi:uncharacterized protein (DUF427 family)